MPNTTIKLLCLAFVLLLLAARCIPGGPSGHEAAVAARPALNKASTVFHAATGSDPYAKIEQVERLLPFTKPGIQSCIRYVANAKALESTGDDKPVPVSAAGHAAAAREIAASKTNAASPMTLRDVLVSWCGNTIQGVLQAVIYFRRAPTIAIAALIVFLLGIVFFRPGRRSRASRNLSANYFAHRPLIPTRPAPVYSPGSYNPSPYPYGNARQVSVAPTLRLPSAGDGARRFIEI